MASITKNATAKTVALLTGANGVNATLRPIAALESFTLPEIGGRQVATENSSIELAERSNEVVYPSIHVYCEKLQNLLREKFRTFSGKASIVIEIRMSQDRIEHLDGKVQCYAQAVTDVLDANRGDWGSGMFFTGGYDLSFGPVKRGGRHFIQAARVTFDIEISR